MNRELTLIVDLGCSGKWLEPAVTWPTWLSAKWLEDNNARLLCQLDKGDHLLPLRTMTPDASRLLAYPVYPVLERIFSTAQKQQLQNAFLRSLGAEKVLALAPGQEQAPSPIHIPRESTERPVDRLSLALVAPLAEADHVIGKHCSSTLPTLSKFYDITLVVANPVDTDRAYPQIDHRRFIQTGASFDRILYHLDNTASHYEYLTLLQSHPGVVVLHDVFLGNCIFGNYREMADIELRQAIYTSHGWSAVAACPDEISDTIAMYPACGTVLENSYATIMRDDSAYSLVTQHFPWANTTHLHVSNHKDNEAQLAAENYRAIMEKAYQQHPLKSTNDLYKKLLPHFAPDLPPQELWECFRVVDDLMSCSHSSVSQVSGCQLLVDISAVVKHDLQTGIQRTVRNLLKELLNDDYGNFRIEPIYYDFDSNCFRYARDFSADFFELKPLYLADDPVEARPGDVYLNPDLFYIVAGEETPRQFLQQWRGRGVRIYNVVYDLLPLLLPHCFPMEQVPLFDSWIRGVTDVSDGVICISRAVAGEYQAWVREQNLRMPPVGYFHLGADLEVHTERPALSAEDQELLTSIQSPYLLMVGTVEPRKGHLLALDAFEELWSRGVEISLVVVGAQGWIDERAKKQIATLQGEQPHFHYLRFVNDGILDALYKGAASTLMASEGEGFGLPLIEAAFRGSPLLLSNLPVFREICGDKAKYFTSRDPKGMADEVEAWLADFHNNALPSSAGIKWNSWKDSTDQMMQCITEQNWLVPGDAPN